MPTRFRWGAALAVGVVMLAAARGPAQEVSWLHSYAEARRAASASGRPLLLDFGTEDCVWCKRLDTITFRDRAVVRLLADRFVAVKLDGIQDAALVDALGIHGYPALVLATPDGKVLDVHEGFLDAAEMRRALERALAAPEPAGEQPGAGLTTPALTGNPANDPAERSRRARELLALAREHYDARRYGDSLACCKAMAPYADLPEGAEARRLASHIKADPDEARRACDSLAASLGALYLELAEESLRANRPRDGVTYLERAASSCPGTPSERTARDRLTQLRAQLDGSAAPKPIIRAQSP
jgi:hypothetical protein